MDDELMAAVPVPLGTEPTGALHHHHDDEDQDDDAKKLKLSKLEDDDDVTRASATPHGNGGGGGSSGSRRRARGGRTHVNEKGEPTMMLPSFIWDYFVKDTTGKFVICTLCPDQRTRFAYSGGTSTMNRHLRKKHQKYAPGKTAADYEYPKNSSSSSSKDHSQRLATSPTDLHAADGTTGALGMHFSPSGDTRRQLLELRNANRRRSTTTKRRKVLSTLEAEQHAAAGDFDPSGFVNLPTHGVTSSAAAGAGGLQFPQPFELSDGTIEDHRFFDYTTLSLSGAAGLAGAGGNAIGGGGLRSSRRPSALSLTASNGTINNSANQKVLTHRLLKFLIAQYEPLDVSRMGMELNVLLYGTDYPSTRLPSEETLKLALANLYYSQREILKEVLAEVEVLSLSLNNWKSVFGQNVLTVSGHWISNGFSRRDCVLEVYVLPLDESVNTIALLRDVMDKWDIPSAKVAALTMLKNGKEESIHEEYPGLAVVNCFVHVLDSAVTAGLEKCAPLICRCRNYVSYFIQNPSEYQIFLSLQRKIAEASAGVDGEEDPEGKTTPGVGTDSGSPKSSGGSLGGGVSPTAVPSLSVICDFEDRWNSTSEMICRIVELEQMLILYKHSLESDSNPNRRPMQLRFVCCELSTEEWTSLKELARLLEPIESVVHVSNLEYPGLSIIYPLLHSIKKHVDAADLWITNSLVATVRNAIAGNLDMQLCASGATPSSPYLSCLLDPRFKTLPFVNAEERERIIQLLKILHEELVGDREKDENEKKSNKNNSAKKAALLHEFFPLDESTNELDKFRTQVQQYLESPSLPPTDESENDPLEWWSRYQRMFPLLAKLAKQYLCISAVSLPFYEAFTNYGQLMREKKARLDIEVAAQILFCRSVSRIPEMDRMNV